MSIGLGIPILQMVLRMSGFFFHDEVPLTNISEFIVEGHRYNIFEDIGCYPFTFNTPIAFPLSIVWPLVIGLVSAVYCGTSTAHAFLRLILMVFP